MRTEIHWIPGKFPGKIGIMARPRGGEWLTDEIRSACKAGAKMVVSLLEAHEVKEFELDAEEALCLQNSLDFISIPIPDRGVPRGRPEMVHLVDRLKRSVGDGHNVVIHCRQGIGRSSLVAALVLLSLGISADTVFELISQARGSPVPDTPEQRQYALTFDFAPR
jgi:protein-tyrosine phosphatase